ncbi:MAG: rane protein of unknown function [Bacteroidota bacterium]|nr:rane protein of unknown function [Bacteroidota bacterium]
MGATQILNIIGLSFDIVGVLMLFKFGLPEQISRDGSIGIILEQSDPEETKKAKLYDRLSYVALTLIVLGFLFQLGGNIVNQNVNNIYSNHSQKCHCPK